MSRLNDFSYAIKVRARFRQDGLCACCGKSLDDLWEHAHHLDPVLAGGSAAVDNCVIICEDCHYVAHNHGRYRTGIVAPQTYFPYINGRWRR